MTSMRCLHLIAHQDGHRIPTRDQNKHKNLKKFYIFKLLLIYLGTTVNGSKWMEIVVKGCIRSINASSWQRIAEMSRNGRKCIGNGRKWIKLTSSGWARTFYVEYQCHVQSYAAAALA